MNLSPQWQWQEQTHVAEVNRDRLSPEWEWQDQTNVAEVSSDRGTAINEANHARIAASQSHTMHMLARREREKIRTSPFYVTCETNLDSFHAHCYKYVDYIYELLMKKI